MTMSHRSFLGLVPILLGACSQGGEETRPKGDVQVSQSHHFFGFSGQRAFGDYPVKNSVVASDRGTLILDEESLYRIRRGNTTSDPAEYLLSKSGELILVVPTGSRTAPTRFFGAYGLEGNTGLLHFCDRHAPATTSLVGLYLGLPVVAATADLTGEWHLFSLHVIFSSSQVLDPANVGRAAGGRVTFDNTGKIAGTGSESSRSSLTFAGQARTFNDGRIDLTVNYKDAQSNDDRVFLTAASSNVVFGLDEDETDGESGLIALVRKRTGNASLAALAGDYIVGVETLFVSPTRSGSDAAWGNLTITDQGAFRIEATGAGAADFTYSGGLELANDGTLTLTVDGTRETWVGAVDQDYRTVVILDHVVEQRSGGKPPELNLFVGLRRVKE
jgi:hypothetical protein